MADKHEEILKFLEDIPETFSILEEGIDEQTQNEYLNYSHSFEQGELNDDETMHISGMLFSTKTPPEAKKKALTLLAHLGTITAYRQIEKYYNTPGNELKTWAALALQECRMFLETSLTDESTGFISSGLGGLDDKMRYYFLVLPSGEKPFTSTQQTIIENEFDLVARDLNCVVETVDSSGSYMGLTALVPLDVAIGTFIETGIEQSNELGDFVFEYYYVTNMDIPGKDEIHDIIKKVREG